jgi:hypothetical protein
MLVAVFTPRILVLAPSTSPESLRLGQVAWFESPATFTLRYIGVVYDEYSGECAGRDRTIKAWQAQ